MTLDEIRAAYADMTPEERRAALPACYAGGYDPSYPEREDLNYKDDEADQQIGAGIAERMVKFERDTGRRSGIDWLGHADDIQRLVDACRIIYHPTYLDWLARNAPEGSRWRPRRVLGQNDARDAGPSYDYPEWPGPTAADVLRDMGFTSWGQLFAEDHEKVLDPAKARRPSKDGIIQHGLGIFEDRPIGVAPMRPVYALIKRFYVSALGLRAFRPEFPFDNDVVSSEYDAKKGKVVKRLGGARSRAAQIERGKLNGAATFLIFVLKEIDFYFSERHAGLVARAFYKQS